MTGVRWPAIASTALAGLAALLVPLSMVTTWAHRELLDTDRYVDTVMPLAEDATVRHDVAAEVAARLEREVDVEAALAGSLPRSLQPLAPPLAESVAQLTVRTTEEMLASPVFIRVWGAANRAAHEQIVALLTSRNEMVDPQGRVVIDLTPIVTQVRTELISRNLFWFERVPVGDLALRYELLDLRGLEQARRAVAFLDRVTWWLTAAALGSVIGSIALAPNRRGAIRRVATSVMAGTAVLLGAWALAQGTLFPDPTAVRVVDIVLRELHLAARAGFALALVAWLAASPRLEEIRVPARLRAVRRAARPLRAAELAALGLIAVTLDSVGIVAVLALLVVAAGWFVGLGALAATERRHPGGLGPGGAT